MHFNRPVDMNHRDIETSHTDGIYLQSFYISTNLERTQHLYLLLERTWNACDQALHDVVEERWRLAAEEDADNHNEHESDVLLRVRLQHGHAHCLNRLISLIKVNPR